MVGGVDGGHGKESVRDAKVSRRTSGHRSAKQNVQGFAQETGVEAQGSREQHQSGVWRSLGTRGHGPGVGRQGRSQGTDHRNTLYAVPRPRVRDPYWTTKSIL